MSLYPAIVWFDLHQLLGADFTDTRRTKAYVTTNVENGTLIDTSTGEIRMGDQAVTINADGTGTFTTWAPGADGNPTSWQTSFVVDYPRTGHRDRARRIFGPYTIGQTARDVTNKALTSNVATITLDAPHGLRVGDVFTVYNVDATFNGTQTVTAVPTTTSLSFAKTAANVTSVATTGQILSEYVSLALLEEEQAVPPAYLTTVTTALDAKVTAAQTAEINAEAAQTATEANINGLGIGATTTGAAGSSASVTLTGTAPDRDFNFTIPRGDQGLPGPGAAAWTAAQTVVIGSVRQAPDGSWIKSTAARTTRPSFDATEQGFWTTVSTTTGTLEQAALDASYAKVTDDNLGVQAEDPTTSGRAWKLRARQVASLTDTPVPTFRPNGPDADYNLALDLMPKGSPGDYFGNGITWLDVCSTDLSDDNSVPTSVARVGIHDDHVELGSRAFNGGAVVPVHLTVGGVDALVLGEDGASTSFGPGLTEALSATFVRQGELSVNVEKQAGASFAARFQAAHDALEALTPSGGIIDVPGGNFSVFTEIQLRVPVVIRGAARGRTKITVDGTHFLALTDDVSFENITFEAASDQWLLKNQTSLPDVARWTFDRCKFHRVGLNLTTCDRDQGDAATFSATGTRVGLGTVVRDCEFYGRTGNETIFIAGTTGVVVESCYLHDFGTDINTGEGIKVLHLATGTRLLHNLIEDGTRDGIDAYNATETTIIGNVIRRCAGGIEIKWATTDVTGIPRRTIVQGNRVEDVTGTGYNLDSHETVCIGNTALRAGGSGYRFSANANGGGTATSRGTFMGNLAIDCGGDGFTGATSTYATFIGNGAYDCTGTGFNLTGAQTLIGNSAQGNGVDYAASGGQNNLGFLANRGATAPHRLSNNTPLAGYASTGNLYELLKVTTADVTQVGSSSMGTRILTSGDIETQGRLISNADNTHDLGNASKRYRNIYATGNVRPLSTKTANYTVTLTEGYVICNGAGAVTITLPDPTTAPVGRSYPVKNISATSVTVQSAGTSKTIDGAATLSLAQWAKATFVSDGTQWLTV